MAGTVPEAEAGLCTYSQAIPRGFGKGGALASIRFHRLPFPFPATPRPGLTTHSPADTAASDPNSRRAGHEKPTKGAPPCLCLALFVGVSSAATGESVPPPPPRALRH
ncbi:hypothetical protein BGZ61DRAFT_29846 [Ilyonectria robusta]|uniref:uncharacterized protein n=1 Tax=Ilyonectria robusta TaxID=1079257 RepID=UPI001E8D7B0B|nr:uncharacterized protein BGZ61DRAFT_29846 [Ilyonectria robusta]KAH8738249.1 hypothetical protein BGZ61DRAFT_29846 [Ilyonectria robusta]